VSFVVGDPESNSDPGPDPSEVQEIEDSFPDEGSDSNYMQMQGAIMPGPGERRKRLRWLFLVVTINERKAASRAGLGFGTREAQVDHEVISRSTMSICARRDLPLLAVIR